MIYLAAPYSHPDPKVMEQRFEAVTKKAAELLNQEQYVYSPITHNHPIAVRHELPRGFEFWREFDLHMLSKSDGLYILTIDGWQNSVGIKEETIFAVKHNIQILHVKPL